MRAYAIRASGLLLAFTMSAACSPNGACSNKILRAAVDKVHAANKAIPARLTTTRGFDDSDPAANVAATALIEACPKLPGVREALGFRFRVDSTPALYREPERTPLQKKTCADEDGYREHSIRRATVAASERTKGPEYEICDFGRYELTNATNYVMSEDGMHLFTLYGVALELGAEPALAKNLARELFVRAPFEVDEAFRAAIPENPAALDSLKPSNPGEGPSDRTDRTDRGTGLGVRVTGGQVLLAGASPVHPDDIASLGTLLGGYAEAWKQRWSDIPELTIAADADVSVGTVVALIELARSVGIDRASLLLSASRFGPLARLGVAAADPDAAAMADTSHLCVDAIGGSVTREGASRSGFLLLRESGYPLLSKLDLRRVVVHAQADLSVGHVVEMLGRAHSMVPGRRDDALVLLPTGKTCADEWPGIPLPLQGTTGG